MEILKRLGPYARHFADGWREEAESVSRERLEEVQLTYGLQGVSSHADPRVEGSIDSHVGSVA
jgi:hypothetical protein